VLTESWQESVKKWAQVLLDSLFEAPEYRKEVSRRGIVDQSMTGAIVDFMFEAIAPPKSNQAHWGPDLYPASARYPGTDKSAACLPSPPVGERKLWYPFYKLLIAGYAQLLHVQREFDREQPCEIFWCHC
jgi:hypothetical protein